MAAKWSSSAPETVETEMFTRHCPFCNGVQIVHLESSREGQRGSGANANVDGSTVM